MYLIAPPAYYHKTVEELIGLILSGDSNIYVGFTTMKLSKRITDHTATRNKKERQRTGPFIKDNGYTFEDCVRVLAEGTKRNMLRLENYFRPAPMMGLNNAIGGQAVIDHKRVQEFFTEDTARAVESFLGNR